MSKMQDFLKCCGTGLCFTTTDLKRCSNCNEIAYCNKEHQSEHFKDGGHKMICKGREKGPLTFQACVEKATKHYNSQMYKAALPYYGAMLELTSKHAGQFHSQNAGILDIMATCYCKLEKYDYALHCLQRCVVIREMENDGSPEKNIASVSLLGRMSEICILRYVYIYVGVLIVC